VTAVSPRALYPPRMASSVGAESAPAAEVVRVAATQGAEAVAAVRALGRDQGFGPAALAELCAAAGTLLDSVAAPCEVIASPCLEDGVRAVDVVVMCDTPFEPDLGVARRLGHPVGVHHDDAGTVAHLRVWSEPPPPPEPGDLPVRVAACVAPRSGENMLRMAWAADGRGRRPRVVLAQGDGPIALAAAEAAESIGVFAAHPDAGPDDVIGQLIAGVGETRDAVVAEIDLDTRRIRVHSSGTSRAVLVQGAETRLLAPQDADDHGPHDGEACWSPGARLLLWAGPGDVHASTSADPVTACAIACRDLLRARDDAAVVAIDLETDDPPPHLVAALLGSPRVVAARLHVALTAFVDAGGPDDRLIAAQVDAVRAVVARLEAPTVEVRVSVLPASDGTVVVLVTSTGDRARTDTLTERLGVTTLPTGAAHDLLLAEVTMVHAEPAAGIRDLAAVVEETAPSPESRRLHQTVVDLTSRQRELIRVTRELQARNELIGELTEELREHARSMAERNAEQRETFAALAHELRTPVYAIRGLLEVMAMERGDELDPALRRDLTSIDESASTLLDSVNEHLEELRAGPRTPVAHREALDLAAIVAEVCELMSTFPRHPGVELILPDTSAVVPVLSDRQKITQIVRNLVGNSLKFTRHGRVEVAVDHDREFARVHVRDTGPGIAPSEVERLFEAFAQSDCVGSATVPGTGLGLTIARNLAQLLGGTITVDATPGVGSSFTLTLPAAPDPAREDRPPSP
jgi:signal transduction histidine kinase